ncbi:MAG: hypothetical protein DYG99_05805 [Bacteroidetes bacterium CHB5]|nr:hypothetical protein [Bacteroidetes bacterium CHB5]
MKTSFHYFILLWLFVPTALVAQSINADKLLRLRDSLDNILIVNPSASAILAKYKEVEVFSFNSLSHNSQQYDKQGNAVVFSGKQILFNSILQVNYGLSRNRRVNIGIDLNYRAYRYSADAGESSLSVFDPSATQTMTYAGVRLRVQPFKRYKTFNYQTNLWLPVASPDAQLALNTHKLNWGHTFFFYKYLNNRIGLFTQANITIAITGSNSSLEDKTELYLPLNLSLSYVVNPKNIFFTSGIYSWITTDISKTFEGGDSDFTQVVVGYQRVVTKKFFLMLNYNTTLTSRNYGKWSGLNLGLRLLY